MSENIYMFEPSEKEMIQAAMNARDTFKYFWRELSWEYRRIVPALDLSIVKFAFETEDKSEGVPSHEHMWISEIKFDGIDITGILMNQPNWIKSIREGDQITQNANLLTDWMYTLEGRAYGGYSVNVMRASMSPEERKGHDQAWGVEFGPPDEVLVTPYIDKKPDGFLSKIFGKSHSKSSGETINYPEHPMSINMGEKIRAALSADSTSINEADEDGWTMIQRESLAGNNNSVKILLEFGADPGLVNPNGHSSTDLARIMGWNEVLQSLNGQNF
ncbi:MAG: DUF2314 domain-containing protein [Candidatus Thiodiazotropha sp.]